MFPDAQQQVCLYYVNANVHAKITLQATETALEATADPSNKEEEDYSKEHLKKA
ncbi:hypothetical protein M441DRAFT_32568 [Trichoderma asperellum CBS 433.97]|uniref:Uncharacterized protein n=1 Tax=Trichoderma asperellum (strain ATCC 204424 / CBS 433.97 / NBRC 101777) TaxID=1042311 RepID=A0A2T3YQ63_TRIA4|nr:hypothetical protein M441DRAFT_32568 [Trichoderma asperellum CBS 433.97]PTB34710.1 hypothetical protein M441DRAFT_32568 [Trichoderma asperellum CBS 433.97]